MTAGASDSRSAAGVLPASRRGWLVVLALLALALTFRVGVVVATRDSYVNLNDAMQFDQIATSIANGDGYGDSVMHLTEGPSAFRGPVYPLLLATIYAVLGDHSFTAGRVFNAMTGVVVVALIGLLGSMLLGRRVGLAALAIASVHPTLVLFTSALMLDALLAALVLGALASALQHRRAPRGMLWPVVSGLLVGAAFLTRETGACAALPVAVLLWGPRSRGWVRAARPALVAGGVAVIVLVPWIVRNAIALDSFVPGTTTGGYGLAGTFNERSRHHPDYPAVWLPPEFDPAMYEVITTMDLPVSEVELDRELTAAAQDYLFANPEYVPQAMFWNTVRLYDLQGPGHAVWYSQFVPYPTSLTRVSVYASYAIYVLALLAAARRALRGTPWAMWLYPVLATLVFAFVSGTIRYRATIEPFLVIAAAAALVQVWDRRWPAPARAGDETRGTGRPGA